MIELRIKKIFLGEMVKEIKEGKPEKLAGPSKKSIM